VFWTGEDKVRSLNHLPNITFEVDPTGSDAAGPSYSSLVFVPAYNRRRAVRSHHP
jgi:hypothetical protein